MESAAKACCSVQSSYSTHPRLHMSDLNVYGWLVHTAAGVKVGHLWYQSVPRAGEHQRLAPWAKCTAGEDARNFLNGGTFLESVYNSSC